jgi:hypothetical protein
MRVGQPIACDQAVTNGRGLPNVAARHQAENRRTGAQKRAHRDELLRQAAAKIALADPALVLAVGFVAAQRDDVGAPVVIASVQTLARANRLNRLPRHFDTVIVDEAHHR